MATAMRLYQTRNVFRNLAVLALAFLFPKPTTAQFIWNGPLNGTTNWSLGQWTPGVPPAGGGTGTNLTFTQIGAGLYTAQNDLGNPFMLTTLNLASDGGGIVISNSAGNTLQFVGSAAINQNGIGVASISANAALTATNTTLGGFGFGNVALSGILSGAGGLIINRSAPQPFTGLIDLTAANTFGGGVTLQSGNLRVGDAMALGSGSLVINGGTIGATSTTSIANNITLNADLVYSGFADLTMTGAISESSARNLVISSMSSNTLTLQGTNTYTGSTSIVVNSQASANPAPIGNLTLSGPNGSAALSSGFTIGGGGVFFLDNSAVGANNNNRVGDGAPITISGGSLIFNGANGGATLENVGTISGRGSVVVELNAGAPANTGTTLRADTLSRLNRGQFTFSGNSTDYGVPLGANVANLIFDTAPTLTGGGGAAGTTTISILPYAVANMVASGANLVTYGANGVRPLSASAGEYAATIVSGTTTANNVRLASTTPAITAPTQINALVINTTTPFTGSTSILTVASGTVLTATVSSTIPAAMTLDFGTAEAKFFNNSELTVNGAITGSNGLTKTGTQSLVLANPANSITGTLTLNQGLVSFSNPAAIATLTDITANGRSVGISTPGLSFSPTTGSTTVNQPMTVTDGFVRLQTGGAGSTLTYSGQIGGAGGVLINGGNIALTNTSNNYTGQTRIFNGNLLVSGDNVLGNGGGVDIGAGSGTGLKLTGNWTTSRRINFSFSSQIDTNGFNWTVNSPITGDATVIEKVGAGIWTLGAGGALGQSQIPGATATTTTINVLAGELRATNPTGSATGTANVNINGTSIISGTGNIRGALTVAPTAFVNPGMSIGTLNFNGTLALNGTFNVEAAGTSADRINVAGALSLGSVSKLNLVGGSFDPGTTYTLMQFASLTGTFATTPGLPATHTLVYDPTTIRLVPVPEPAYILLVCIACLAVFRLFQLRRPKQCA